MTDAADASQMAVVAAPADVRLVVTAPPGAGKTWTAAARLQRLANTQEGDEGGALLALSFSRAAAFALTAQLHRAGVGARVEVRTVDSWAGSIAASYLDRDPERPGHDATVSAVATLLEERDDELISYQHVVVDEAQDIHGVRADLIDLLLDRRRSLGWTVLGDPAQAIFEFDANGSDHLLKRVARRPGARHLQLSGAHRAMTKATEQIVALGEPLREDPPGAAGQRAVWDAYWQLRALDLDGLLSAARNYASGDVTTAVLLRDNRRVLDLSSRLGDRSIDHVVTGSRQEGLVPSWVAWLCPSSGTVLDDDGVAQLLPATIDPVPVIRALRFICPTTTKRIVTEGLADRMLAGRLPEAMLQPAGSALTLSTIHRSKGLEYDKVFVSMDGVSSSGSPEETDDATRVLYVAMTRARSTVHRLALKSKIEACIDARIHRWTDTRFIGRSRVVTALELRPADVNFLAPWHGVTDRLGPLGDTAIGTPVTLEREGSGPTGVASFRVLRAPDGVWLGSTAPAFGAAAEQLGLAAERLVGGRVVGLGTFALPRAATPDRRRLFVGPVIRGMVSPLQGG